MRTRHHGDWSATWIAGPDSGTSFTFSAGEDAVVGRAAQADVRCDDPDLEPFHLRVRRGSADGWHVVQLAGRTPVHLHGDCIVAGTSTLGLRSANRAEGGERGPAIAGTAVADEPVAVTEPVVVNRTPRAIDRWDPDPVTRQHCGPAPSQPTNGGLLPAVIALAGAALVALVLGQPMFVLFGVIGAITAIAAWVAARMNHRRRCKEHATSVAAHALRFDDDLAAQRSAWSEFHRSAAPSLHRAIADLRVGPAHIWRRRVGHPDVHTVCLGLGDVVFEPRVHASVATPDSAGAQASGVAGAIALCGALHPAAVVVADHPVCAELGPGARIAVSGSSAPAVVRAALVGLAISTGPADWQLVIVTEQPQRWAWASELPHLSDGAGANRILAAGDLLELIREGGAWTSCHTVVITDMTEQLSLRTAPLRRLISLDPDVAVVAVIAVGAPVPAICRTVITTRVDGTARLVSDAQASARPIPFRSVGIGEHAARKVASLLALHRDPEDPKTAAGDTPHSVSLAGLLIERGVDPFDHASIGRRWIDGGADPAPCAPIGRAADGVVDIDLQRDGPHGLFAGTTGAGKSELLRSLVVGLAACVGPDRLTFVLIDYKGGATFDALAPLPHVVGTVTDLDGALADRALRSLRAEVTARERMLRDLGSIDLPAARRSQGAPVFPRLVVVVDEFAALAVEHPGFLHALVDVAQRGRSLGVHLLLATQRPNGVIDDAIRANTALRVALRLNDVGDALDVVGDPTPATFSRSIPGRAVMRLGPDDLVTFQTASCPTGDGGLGRMVASIAHAADVAGIEPPRRPWLDPLPARLEGTELEPGVVGIVDAPDEQAQHPLRWVPDDGHLLVAGSQGSGVTSTLLTLTAAAIAAPEPPALFVVDGLGDDRWDAVSEHPRCAAVVRIHHRERLWRLLARLSSWSPAQGRAVLVVDGIAALRHELEPFERSVDHGLFERLVAEAETLGVTMIIGTDTLSNFPASLLARCAQRWVMHFHDPHDGLALGVPVSAMPADLPGRVVLAGTLGHRCAQVIAPHPISPRTRRSGQDRSAQTPLVQRVDELAASVHAEMLARSSRDGTTWRAVLGTRFDDLGPLELDVPDGDHVLIVGPGRCGKSSALARFIDAWGDAAMPANGSAVVVLAPRRSPVPATCGSVDDAVAAVLGHLAAGRPTLLAVDDADLVHDDSGRLTTLVAARTANLVVVAAGRSDALRQSYGHWTTAVRRSRLGLILAGSCAGASEIDADLFGVVLPRSLAVLVRPGLGHVVDRGDLVLGQIAVPLRDDGSPQFRDGTRVAVS